MRRILFFFIICLIAAYGIGRWHKGQSFTAKQVQDRERLERALEKVRGFERLPSGYSLRIERDSNYPF